MKRKHPNDILLIICLFLIFSLPLIAQINYVPNPSFEDITDCAIEFGEADKARFWQIIDVPNTSPDLYHACATGPFYGIPDGEGDFAIFPKSGEGMVGLVNSNKITNEKIYARLLDDLPTDIDIYVAFSTITRRKSFTPMEILCYSNTQSLAFSNIQFESRVVPLKLNQVLADSDEWTLVESCYRASGEEKLVLIGDYLLTTEAVFDCDFIDNNNFAYLYVDDIIVSPFDVVPDTLFLCGGELLNVDATFYEVPIEWSDGIQGAIRTIEKGGRYTVMGSLKDCFLTDETLVIELPDKTDTIRVILCENELVALESPIPAVWENGDTSRTLTIRQPGVYTANLLSDCGARLRKYIVAEEECTIQYFVPNVFSPNGDGINDAAAFFFESEFDFSGNLSIFDRLGNLLFYRKEIDGTDVVSWDGTYQGEALNPTVLVWVYQYVSSKDGAPKVISGDITLIR